MSTHFWDENPKGIWTLQLENKGDDSNTGGCDPHFYWGHPGLGHSSFPHLHGRVAGFLLLLSLCWL